MSKTTPSTDHPLLNEQTTIELDGVTFTHQPNPPNYNNRFRAFSSMKDYHFETVLRHIKETGSIHRTTTIYNEYDHIINQVTETMDTELEKLDRKNVKTLVSNYMTAQALQELR